MQLPFIRSGNVQEELNIFPESLLEDTTSIVTQWQDAVVTSTPQVQSDPVRKAAYLRIGLVSVEDEPRLPAVLGDATRSDLVHCIRLPRNPRIADNELYELDGMDYIVMLTTSQQRITKYMVRWLKRLKHMNIPMLVLLTYEVKKRREQHQIDVFSKRIAVPFISVVEEDTEMAREKFVSQTLEHMPAISLALAASAPTFRLPLMENLLANATADSMLVDNPESIQTDLVRQICAAFGLTEREVEKNRVALDTMVKSTEPVAKSLVRLFPIFSDQRRARLTNAVSTLLVGHATKMHLGASAPSLGKDLLPQIWRLYRASKQSVS